MNDARNLIRCPGCGTILAANVAGLSVVTRKGFEWIGQVVSMRCTCGALWQPDESVQDDAQKSSMLRTRTA